ncbi:MAG: zf-TFIIB domain-containing protein [Candidatus Omnitrophica bacterium]|nr:zf-TFIIB domain-containing protein [Candidatus Omnitrophota bacterium]
MNCPICQTSMVILELNQVEIDHCLQCRGIWLDVGELEILFEAAETKESFLKLLSSVKAGKDKEKKCPICLKSMDKVLYGESEGKALMIDKCRKNHGLWFDFGELEEILQLSSSGQSSKVLNLLQEMFGKGMQSKG